MPAPRLLPLFMILAMLVACAGVAGGAPSRRARHAAASDSCLVRGRLLGADGEPMRFAYVQVVQRAGPRVIVHRDGSFGLAIPRPGGYLFAADGVHHRRMLVPVMFDRPGTVELEIRLGSFEYADPIDSVSVLGSFNGWDESSAVSLERQADGSFAAAVACTSSMVRYQVRGVARNGVSLCGTDADTFLVRARDGSLFSGLRRGCPGTVRITFDPRRLPPAGLPARVTSTDPGGTAAGLAAIYQDLDRRLQKFFDAMAAVRGSGGSMDTVHWDWKPDLDAVLAAIPRERNPVLRQYRLLEYFKLAESDGDSLLARRVLEEVPPESPLWSLDLTSAGMLAERVAAYARAPRAARAFEERMAAANPDTAVQASVLYSLISTTQSSGDTTGFGGYYARMTTEFAGRWEADLARKQFAPDRAIQRGKPVPAFALVDLEDTSRVYRPGDFKGRYLLIDFWSTWCGPCRGEMKTLHDAYAKYHGRGLEMLSVSYDVDRKEVRSFRGGKWPMPWLNAFDGEGFEGATAKLFEIYGIPRAVLVGPDGTIVAVENELRGEQLDRTLAALLPAGDPAR